MVDWPVIVLSRIELPGLSEKMDVLRETESEERPWEVGAKETLSLGGDILLL